MNKTRDKQFIVASIKMDLHRVVTAAANINKELPEKSIVEFIQHADKDFGAINLTQREKLLRKQLQQSLKRLPNIRDPWSRLRWAEDVLTIRCRL